MKLVFFGSGAFGLPTLRALMQNHEVGLVVTQPDRPAGRNRALTPTPIAAFSEERRVPIVKPENVNDATAVAKISATNPNAMVVIAYGHKLGPALLADVFAINLHASLLPKYRGAAPINWAMINDESETGVSVITLAQTMDAGDILGAASTPIAPLETAGELHDRLAEMGPELVMKVLEDFHSGSLRRAVQDPAGVTPAPKLSKADGTVRFDQPARRVRQRIHGLTPWPGCTVNLGGHALRLIRVEEVDEGSMKVADGAAPGTMSEVGIVACAPGAIRLLEVQPPGGRIMSFDDYRRGHQVPKGAKCEPV